MENGSGWVMVAAGAITMNLIFLLFTLVAGKLLNLKISAASLIAAISLTWPTMLAFTALMPPEVNSKWVGGAFMVLGLVIYVCWLRIFEPDNLQDLIRKDLRKKELKRVRLIRDQLKSDLAQALKLKSQQLIIDDLQAKIKDTYLAEKQIKRLHRRASIFRSLVKKKGVTANFKTVDTGDGNSETKKNKRKKDKNS